MNVYHHLLYFSCPELDRGRAQQKKKTTIFLQLNFKTSSWFGLRSRATQDLKCPEQEQEYKKAQLKKKGYSQIFCTLPFTLVK